MSVLSEEERADYIWMDGKQVKWDDAKVHIKAHVLSYGTGVFEGIRGYAYNDNVNIFRLRKHLDRLYYSAMIYRMNIPFTKEELKNAIVKLIIDNEMRVDCYIRPLVYRGYGPFGVNPLRSPINVAIYVIPIGEYLGKGATKRGIKCLVSSWQRIPSHAIPIHAKACGNYLNSVIARLEAIERNYDEAIFLDHRGFISEGTGENLFAVKDGRASTPPSYASILMGITRDSLITLLKEELHIEVVETDITRASLYDMDEVFICGTAGEITPVVVIDHTEVGDGKPGPLTKRLQRVYLDTVRGKISRYSNWIMPVY
ncbi:MAG: branched-chain amino acid transaminase [Promethearchaeota archaeon]